MDKINFVVKKVLDDFFDVSEEEELFTVTEEDTSLLSEAISDAIKKELLHESKN